jgi:glycosyltransferase involved in cell wall biosynthesis
MLKEFHSKEGLRLARSVCRSPHVSCDGIIPEADDDPEDAPDLSVVVPCYNEEEVLTELCRRLYNVNEKIGLSYEIILVNDGSVDKTWPLMLGLGATDPHLVLINLSRNHGHQLALTAGLTFCRGRRILIIDADLQDPPESLPEMLRLMDAGADVVYGRRRRREGESVSKLLTASLFYRLIEKLTDVPIPRDTGDFRLMSRRALDVLLAMPERHRFIRGMVSWIGFNQVPFDYDRHVRYAGTTKYPLAKMIRFAFDAITAFSVKPLALASWVGFITGLFAIALLVYTLASWLGLLGEGLVTGWTSLMATVALLGSAQLLVLGILGEYMGRMYEQSKGRPLFVVEQVLRSCARAHVAGEEGQEAVCTHGEMLSDRELKHE